jgi:PAS domain-containing protein
LRKAHAELERRVWERTAELATTNEVLRVEVIERMRAEERLRESEARLQSILKSLEDCIWSSSVSFRESVVKKEKKSASGLAKADV